MRYIVIFLMLFGVSELSNADSLIDLRGDAAREKLNELRIEISDKPDKISALKNAGIILHQLSRLKPIKDDIYEAEKYLKIVTKSDRDDNEALAWQGSVITMKAQFETDPGKQTFYVKSGSIKMDKAIKRDPDNTIVRLTRAYNSLEIPPFLKRTRFAVIDFEYYLALCERTKECTDDYISSAKMGLAKAKDIVALSGN